MVSVEKETVPFQQPIDPALANGMVEKWMLQVEFAMKKAISDQLHESHADYTRKERSQWAIDWPGMVVLVIDQVFWTRETEAALNERGLAGLKEYEAQCTQQLNDVVQLVRRRDLSKLNRATLGAMVTLDVHGRDVLTMMVKSGVESTVGCTRTQPEPEPEPELEPEPEPEP